MSRSGAVLDFPVGDPPRVLLLPAIDEIGESRLVDDAGERALHFLPEVWERGVPRQVAALPLARGGNRSIDVAQHVSHSDAPRWARQKIASVGSAPRAEKTTLLELGKDQLQEFLRDLLPGSYFGDLDGVRTAPTRQIEYGAQSVFTLNRLRPSYNLYQFTRDCRAGGLFSRANRAKNQYSQVNAYTSRLRC